MPYADKERKRAYNREWSKSHYRSGALASAFTPQANRIAETLRAANRPLERREIIAELRSATATPNSVTVCLNRMKKAGRVRSLGYSQWVIAE